MDRNNVLLKIEGNNDRNIQLLTCFISAFKSKIQWTLENGILNQSFGANEERTIPSFSLFASAAKRKKL